MSVSMIRVFIISLSIFVVMVSCNTIEKKGGSTLPSIALIVRTPPVSTTAMIAGEENEPDQEEIISGLQNDVIQDSEIIPELNAEVDRESGHETVEDPPEILEENFKLGLIKAEEGNHRDAIDAYRMAIQTSPENKRAHYNIVLEYIQVGNLQRAAEEYRALHSMDPDMADELHRKAVGLALENKNRTFTVQVGLYINKRFAVTMSEILRDEYLTAYIERDNNFYNVRIAGIHSRALGNEIVRKVNKRFRIKTALMTSEEAAVLSKKNESGNRSFRSSNYMVQVGAYKNINYANDMMTRLQDDKMPSFIKREGTFNKVRIRGIKTVEEGSLMVDNIYNKYKVEPFILRGK